MVESPMSEMTMEEAIAYCVRKGFGVETESPGRVTMVKHRFFGRAKVLMLTEEDGRIYYTSRTGKRRFPSTCLGCWLSGPHF